MKKTLSANAFLAIGLIFTLARADVAPAPYFTDNAVLQRGKPAAVFGTATPGEKVNVSFKGQTKAATANADGKWLVRLDPMQADAQGAPLVIEGTNKIELKNVVVGDVWLCGGQSNMEWPVRTTLNADAVVAASKNPLIRQIKAEHTPFSAPQTQGNVIEWQEASPQTTGEFTAPGYFMAVELQKELGVPIGLLNISHGGTMVEAWMSKEAVENNPQYAGVKAQWERTLSAYPARKAAYDKALAKWQADKASGKKVGREPRAPEGPGSRVEPASLYNGMLHPAIPYSVAGILWYQGEANAPRYVEYGDLIRGLIRQWRAEFDQGDLPFYYVELANNKRGTDKTGYQWAYMREAQKAALQEPNTAYVTAVDIGESDNPHFKNKKTLGERFALCALKNYYGKNVEALGPQFASATVDGQKYRVRFTHAEGLHMDAGKPSFELAGEDKVFHPAQAVIEGDTVVVTAPEVAKPVAVRYFFRTDPSGWAVLRNAAGLPASPLRNDSWPEPAPTR